MPTLPRKPLFTFAGIVAVFGLVAIHPTDDTIKVGIAAVVGLVGSLLAAHTVSDVSAMRHGKK